MTLPYLTTSAHATVLTLSWMAMANQALRTRARLQSRGVPVLHACRRDLELIDEFLARKAAAPRRCP